MGRILVLAEKPAMGRDIARVLNCTHKGSGGGYLVGTDYVVTWSIGHLITLCDAADYDPSFKRWKEELLPIIPKQMQIKLIAQDERQVQQYNIIKSLMNSPDVDEVVCSCDAGREGELIFRYIYKMAGCTKKIKRLWISSLTDDAILEGFQRLRPGEEYDNLYYSALSRSYADWLVGINTTRAYSIKYGAKLTIGRVQTPTLCLLVERQKEIEDFKSKDFWEIQSFYNKGFSGYWINKETHESKIKSKDMAERIASKVREKPGVVTDIKEDMIRDLPPLLYDLTELQRDANRKYGFTASDTLEIAQKLYEQRKYITYPRTDSRYLTSDIAGTLMQRISSIQVGPYVKTAGYILNGSDLQITNRIVDNEKVSDHHAIIPTGVKVNIEALSEDEERVYDLIVRRFLSAFYPRYEYSIKTVEVECEDELFISKGRTIINLGWMECYKAAAEEDDDEKSKKTVMRDQELPSIKIGDTIKITEAKVHYNKTRPPAAYTEDTLLSAMENVGRFVDNKDLKDRLKAAKGLGTPATRAAIIEKIIDSGYVKRRNGKFLIPTQKGMKLIDIVHEELKSPEMTGQWEKALENIVEGSMSMSIFMRCIIDFIKETIEEVKYSEKREVIFDEDKPVYRR